MKKIPIVLFGFVLSLSAYSASNQTSDAKSLPTLEKGQKPVSQLINEDDIKSLEGDQPKTETQPNTQNEPGNQNVNPGLNPTAVGETPSDDAIPIVTKSKDPSPLAYNGNGTEFSTYKYLTMIKNCTSGFLSAGADTVDILGYKKGRCHVTYSFAGRIVDCLFTRKQLDILASPERLAQAKEFDRGVGMILRPIGTDDPSSPLSTCQQ